MANIEKQKKQQKPIVDILKYFFALCVVAIHTNILYSIFSYEVAFFLEKFILRLAVPFFFVATGYFLRCKIKDDFSNTKEQVLNYCKKLFKPYLVFLLIAIASELILFYIQGNTDYLGLLLNNIKKIIFYPQNALWFVWACIIGALLLIPFLKRNKLNLAIILGFILYLIMLLFNSYSFILSDLGYEIIINNVLYAIISLRNGIHVGFFMLSLGMKCYDIEKKCNKQLIGINKELIGINRNAVLFGGGVINCIRN